ncbi:MAG: pyridoxamine 5'-phosphate oxidase family protein [Bryobacteraceae bacterium]
MGEPSPLAISNRPGNRRGNTFHNILDNPRAGLPFLVPGKTETLRVNGGAQLVMRDVDGVSRPYAGSGAGRDGGGSLLSSKCMIRSSLWKPEQWPPLEGVASLTVALTEALTEALAEVAATRVEELEK